MLIVIVGESGSGKTTLADELLRKGYSRIVTATTRKRRRNEPEDAYRFVSEEEFRRMQEDGSLAESAVYNGNGYGTPAGDVISALEPGRRSVIVLTPDGMRSVRNLAEATGQRSGLVVAYLYVDRESRLRKLLSTRDDADECLARVAGDEATYAGMEDEADIVIHNEGYARSPDVLAGELNGRSRMLCVIRIAPPGEGHMIRNGVSEKSRHERNNGKEEHSR